MKPSPVNRVIMIVKGTGGAYEIFLNSNGVVEASASGGNKQVWTISADKSREIIKRAEKLLVARLADSYSLDPTYLEDYCLKIFANNREITVNLLHKGNVDIVPNDLMAVVNSMAGLSKW